MNNVLQYMEETFIEHMTELFIRIENRMAIVISTELSRNDYSVEN